MAAIFTILLWGTTFISTKILLRDFAPAEILIIRFVIGLIALVIACPKPIRGTTLRQELTFAGAGLSGITLYYLLDVLKLRKAASIRICTLLDKPERRAKPIQADYTGFVVPDAFVVGYGLDYNQQYRNLPYIGVLKEEVYS